MASFGARYPYFCPVADEPEGALPIYEGAPVRIGRLVKSDLSVTLASGELFADDVLAESVAEFASGSIAMETDDMEDEIASVVYGATVEDGAVCYAVGDDPPTGGLAYMKKLMRNKKTLYKGYFIRWSRRLWVTIPLRPRAAASPSVPLPLRSPSTPAKPARGGSPMRLRRKPRFWHG